MEHLDNFRNEVKVWLDDNCPPSMRTGADPEIPHDEVWGGRKASRSRRIKRRIWPLRMFWAAPPMDRRLTP